jgi:hypothetical protein
MMSMKISFGALRVSQHVPLISIFTILLLK